MTCLKNSLSLTAMLVTLASATSYAQATTTTSPIAVSATVTSTCSIVAQPLVFGSYASVQTDASTTVSVTCTNGTTYSVALDAGQGSGGTTALRVMTGPGSAPLNYTVYSNSARSTIWGNTPGSNVVAGTGVGTGQVLTVYGRIPANQYPTPGAYTDSITATLTY